VGRIAGVTAEETRRRLLDAAAAEFDRRGFEGTRVADIAAGAELSNGALYGHFRSKTELLSAALTDRGARELQALFEGADGRSIADLLAGIGRSLTRMAQERGGLMVEALVAARRDPEVAEVTSRHLVEGQAWLTGLIREGQAHGTIDDGVDPEALARFCAMLLFGAMLLAPADLPEVPKAGWADLIERVAVAVSARPG
jgi:AcrR family transcriptional regulator